MRNRPALPILFMVLGLAGCATGPRERIVRAQFACDDASKLQVAFNLDQGAAIVRLSRKVSVTLPHVGDGHGRDYAGDGYSLRGVGDSITFTPPTGPPKRCVETR